MNRWRVRSSEASPSPYRPGRNDAFGLLLTALATKIRPPHTTGLECAGPGIGVRHRMFSLLAPSQRSGRFCPSAAPDARTPRNDGQLPASAVAAGIVTRDEAAVLTMFLTGTGTVSPDGRHRLPSRIIRRGAQASATRSKVTCGLSLSTVTR